MSNKVKIGDKVKLKMSRIQWTRDHIDAYIYGGSNRLDWESYAKDLYIDENLVGECVGYGSIDESSKNKQKRFIRISFETPLGTTSSYYSELDVLVKRKR